MVERFFKMGKTVVCLYVDGKKSSRVRKFDAVRERRENC